MSPSFSKCLGFSSTLKIEEEMVTKKQGIVSILGTDSERSTNKAASLRRTLSADMSSKKWLSQNGFFSPMKKTASSDQFPVSIMDSSSSDEEEDYDQERKETETPNQFDIWSSIQQEKNNKKNIEKPYQFSIWDSIISQKAQEDSKSIPPPYIHPLVKRSASSLTEKSLEICTESLGSETGSDGFSSSPPSETGDIEEDKEEEQEVQHQPQQEEKVATNFYAEDFRVVKYNSVKKMPQRSFPPPIPSLSGGGGSSLSMKSHRDNGRLVLEAVSVISHTNFLAQRQGGRLVLSFANSPINEEEPKIEEEKNEEEFEEEFENFEEDRESEKEDEEEVEEEVDNERMGCVTEKAPKLSSGVINVHRLALMMNKPTGLTNRNPTWPNKFNEAVKIFEVEEVEPTPVAQSLPPRPPRLIPSGPISTAATVGTAAASFNVYEYYWRPKPMAADGPLKNSNNKLILSKNPMPNEQKQLFVMRENKGDYLGCKEPRRSLLFWEPYCIATS